MVGTHNVLDLALRIVTEGIFLLVFDVLLLAASLRAAASRIAPGLLVLNAIGIGFWFERNYSPEDRPFVWCSLCVIFALFLSQQMARRKFAHARADTGEVMVAVGTGMGYFGMSYYLLEDSYSGWMGIFALALAVVYLAAARILNTMSEEARPVALAFIGVSLTLLTLAIPIQLEQNWITIGWAAEAVVLAGLKSLSAAVPDEFDAGEMQALLAEGEESVAREGTLDADEALTSLS